MSYPSCGADVSVVDLLELTSNEKTSACRVALLQSLSANGYSTEIEPGTRIDRNNRSEQTSVIFSEMRVVNTLG